MRKNVISFDAVTRDGMIEIPEEFRGELKENVAVTVIVGHLPRKSDLIPCFGIHTAGFVFNREEANER